MFVGPPQAYCMTYIGSEHGLGYIIVLLCKRGACYICACYNLKLSPGVRLSDTRLDVCLLLSQLCALCALRLFWGLGQYIYACLYLEALLTCLCMFVKFVHIFMAYVLHSSCSQNIYRVSQEECARRQQGVPYVKVYRYNPKNLCPKLNGYGDNGQRSLKLWQLLHTYWLPNTH